MALLLLKLEATTWKCIGTVAVSLLARLAYTRGGFALSTSRGAQDRQTLPLQHAVPLGRMRHS